jgi:hypothetical protein
MSINKFCANCGSPRKEGAKFCKECGQPMPQGSLTSPEDAPEMMDSTKTQGPSVPEIVESTEIVSTPVPESQASTEITATAENSAESDAPAFIVSTRPPGKFSELLARTLNQRTKKPLLYGAALIGIVLISVIIWSIWASISSHSSPLVYIKDFELMIKTSKYDESSIATKNWLYTEGEDGDFSSDGITSTQDTQFYRIGSYLQQFVKMNERGTRMFYLSKFSDEKTADLYYSAPSQVAKSGEESTDQGVRIASNLSLYQDGIDDHEAFQISKSGDYVLYLKNYEDNSGGSLYLYNMTEEILIDNHVAANYSLSEDESSIIYMKTPDDETYDLYTTSVGGKRAKVKIDIDIGEIINYSSDLETIYYTKYNEDPDNINLNSLYVKHKGKDKQKLISDYAGLESASPTEQFFFTRTTMRSTKLMDLITDDWAAEDLKINEPVYDDYQYEESSLDYWGDSITTTKIDNAGYDTAYSVYQDKLNRDSLRSDLNNEELATTTMQLFLYSGGKETEISSEFSRSIYADAASGSIIYMKAIEDQVDKIKLSEISDTSDVQTLYQNNITESASNYLVLNGAAEQEMPEETNGSYTFTFSKDGKKLYSTAGESDDYSSTLVVWDILGSKLSNRMIIAENVDQYMLVNDVIWYYRDVKDGKGELFTYNDGKDVKIAFDVQLGNTTFYPEDDVVLYMTDFNAKRLTGSLFMQRGDKNIKINDDVNFYNYNNGTDLFYISDYRLKNGEGDLWEFRGKDNKKLIDSGVQTMLPMKQGLTF